MSGVKLHLTQIMSDFKSQFPDRNTIQFVKADVVRPSKYHTALPDQEWFYENLRKWETKRKYAQKIEHNDKIYMECHRSELNDVSFYILDSCGRKVEDPDNSGNDLYRAADFVIYDSGSVYTYPDGTTVALSVHKWSFRFADFDLSDGLYYVYVPIEFYDGDTLLDTKYWISEPIHLKDAHEDTILFESWCNTNKKDIIWTYSSNNPSGYKGTTPFFTPKFCYRVEGARLTAEKLQSNDVFFKEQDYEQRNLDSTDWSVSKYYVSKVPQYVLEKLNACMSNDVIYIEGRRYVKNDGAEWQVEEAPQYPLFSAEIEVREYDRQDRITDTRGITTALYEEPDSYPYAIYSIGLSGGYRMIKRVIYDSGDRDDMIDEMNDQREIFDLSGNFYYEDGSIYYESGNGETETAITPEIFTQYHSLSVVTSASNQTLQYEFANTKAVIDWGDNTLTRRVDATTLTTYTHTFDNADSYTVRCFTKSTAEDIRILGNLFTATVNGLTGTMPTGLKQLIVTNCDFSGGFALGILANARYSIESFSFANCQIDSITDTVFSTYTSIGIGGDSNNWVNLYYLGFYNNALDVAGVEGVLVDFYENAPHLTPGTIDLHQNPTANITNAPATTYKTNLINAGWVIVS